VDSREEDAGGTGETATASVEFTIAGRRMKAEIGVPAGPTDPAELLPLFQSFTEMVVGIGVRDAEAAGGRITCCKGCGACCRQLVPLSPAEARHLRALIDRLPEPRRAEILARFADARRRLEGAGLLDQLLDPRSLAPEDVTPFGLEYFRLGVPCPFLEDEACSIHEDRPLACREFLVTSPAEHCADPSTNLVRRIPIPGRTSVAVALLGEAMDETRLPWVPLILAPEWADAHPDVELRPGTAWLEEFIARVAQQVPAPEGAPPPNAPSDGNSG
jgi:Fe-S-cluster containining protein